MELFFQKCKKLKTHRIFLIAIAFFFLPRINAQYYVSENSPASIKWNQINTENFQVVFPENFSTKAQEVANLLEQAYDYSTHSLKRKPKKVSLIIHNQTAISNGMAVWAPKRMEWYSPPPRDTYAQDWFEQLTIHEFRHIIQIDKLNQGLTKLFSYLFGQQTTAAVLGLYVPLWFLEGDAVTSETLLSKSGRGRSADFNKDMKAQVLEKGYYSYDKAVFGSYKDYVPNHYKLGYLLVSEGRRRYGSELWESTLNKIAKKPHSINPFSRGLKKGTGFHKKKFYENVMDTLTAEWTDNKRFQKIKQGKRITNPVATNYSDYLYPHKTSENKIFALKTSMDNIPIIVQIGNENKEKSIHKIGFVPDYQINIKGNKICWSEYKFGTRWGLKSSAIIKVIDTQKNEEFTIWGSKKYYTPKLSNNEKKIVAVSISNKNDFAIHIINTPEKNRSKARIIDLVSVGNDLLLDPSWNADDEEITFVALNQEEGKSIYTYNLKTKKTKKIFTSNFHEISEPQFYKDKNIIIFNANFTGADNFFAINTKTQQISQLTFAEYGAKYASVHKSKLIYSEYTADGFMISESDINFKDEIDWLTLVDSHPKISKKLLAQEKRIIAFDKSKFAKYEEKKYSKAGNLINIHSWAPFYLDTDDYNVNPGVSFFSQNLLSTAVTTLGYEWDVNEQRGIYRAGFSYKGWYPTLSTEFDHTRRWANYSDSSMQSTQKIYWDETSASFDISVPLRWNKGPFLYGVTPQVGTSYFDRSNLTLENQKFTLDNYQSIEYDLFLYRYIRTAKRDLFPKFGQILSISYQHTPFQGYDLGEVYSAESRLYFPGLAKHNHLIVDAGFQRKNANSRFGFSNLINYPRGYTDIVENNFNYVYFNYSLPICYPDFSLGGLAYLKRIKTNLFLDYGENNKGKVYNSVGIDFSTDTHLFRFIAPIELGVRNVYIPQQSTLSQELLISINFDDI